jgi:hypothetical protein
MTESVVFADQRAEFAEAAGDDVENTRSRHRRPGPPEPAGDARTLTDATLAAVGPGPRRR